MSKQNQCTLDIAKERETPLFVKEEITYLLDGSKEKTELRRNIEKYFLSDPHFDDPIPSDYLSYIDKYSNDLRKACRIVEKINNDEEIQHLTGQMDGMRMILGSGLGSALTKDGNPLAVHYVMFLPALFGQGSLDQQAHWIGKAWSGEIIGTYAQTELGHGTFVRGLETTATYDPSTQEFILNTPSISGYKFWPGGLGKTANHAVVMAQLYTEGKCYGPHPFIVQLRDTNTHKRLPGIDVGEIGPKLGLATNDNGFLGFKNHRIPRNHMLMKHSQVLEDGTYCKPPNSKLSYATMVFVRVAICFDSTRQLQRAVTIATRYAAVRRQSELVPGEPEPKIIEYKTQQEKLFPHIASVVALILASRKLWETYAKVSEGIDSEDLEMLPELHAISCGLKAQCSDDCSTGVDILRRACGGHGYLSSSNLPKIFCQLTAACTYEGENTVMWLQLARYMMKVYSSRNRHSSQSLNYLKNNVPKFLDDLSCNDLLLRWQAAIKYLVENAAQKLESLQKSGLKYEHAWNECSILLVNLAAAHIRYYTCEQLVVSVNSILVSPSTKSVLKDLSRLYNIYHFLENQGILLKSGTVTPRMLSALENEKYQLYSKIRPAAVQIVDAFDFPDKVLDSTLGAYDGDVYNRIFKEVMKSPLNQKDVPDAYHKYLQPVMKAKL